MVAWTRCTNQGGREGKDTEESEVTSVWAGSWGAGTRVPFPGEGDTCGCGRRVYSDASCIYMLHTQPSAFITWRGSTEGAAFKGLELRELGRFKTRFESPTLADAWDSHGRMGSLGRGVGRVEEEV